MSAKIVIEHLSVRYADQAESLRDVSLNIEENAITALFGPAGGGKSTLLRTINRLNDLADVTLMKGSVMLNGLNILDSNINVMTLRRKVGMVFSRPLPLPLSVYDNVCYGLTIAGERRKSVLNEAVEKALRQVTLWDELYDRLRAPANTLSGGQQQRLSIARVLALQPEVILLDEPTSALDPVATAKIESLLRDLSESITIVIAPHNTQQAARVSDYAAFFLTGELVEYGPKAQMVTLPKDKRTQDYIEGRFG
ncbi:MAG TPA: phosphate ABC transporter ATP-binding protein [Anaerolineae bacterium]